MRETEFRGKIINTWDKNKNTGDWVYGNLIQNEDASFIVEKVKDSFIGYCDDCDKVFANMYRVDEKTIGQYTGVRDIYQIRIFEGDIVAYDEDVNTGRGYSKKRKITGIVRYVDNRFLICDMIDEEFILKYNLESCRVIGKESTLDNKGEIK